MAIAHGCRLARDLDLHGAAKALTRVRLRHARLLSAYARPAQVYAPRVRRPPTQGRKNSLKRNGNML